MMTNPATWRPRRLGSAGVVALLTTACALGPGQPHREVEGVLRLHPFDPSGREAEAGWLRLSSDFELQLETFALGVGALTLQGPTSGGGGGSFDPQNPPEGYSCHGGHCHTPDGRTLTYEQIAAELAGGGGLAPVLTLHTTSELLELPGTDGAVERPLRCEEGCHLPLGTVTRTSTSLTALQVSGRVRDRRSPPRFEGERTFAFSLPDEDTPLALSATTEVTTDRFSTAVVFLEADLRPAPALFDEVGWHTLSEAPAGHLQLDSEANHEALDELLATIQTSLFRPSISGDDLGR